jgi:hypothetical protein
MRQPPGRQLPTACTWHAVPGPGPATPDGVAPSTPPTTHTTTTYLARIPGTVRTQRALHERVFV